MRERAGRGKLEGRRSRPGLVLGLADSLALSQRNASNAGEPLLPPSFFRSCRSSLHLSLSFLPHLLLALILRRSPALLFLRFSFSFSFLPPGPPFHSVHSLLHRDGRGEGDTRCIAYQAAFSSLSRSARARTRATSPSFLSRSNFAFSGRDIRKRKDVDEGRIQSERAWGREQGRE